jgi:hypothetical protein
MSNNKRNKTSIVKFLSITLMCGCLLFLTGLNFALFPSADAIALMVEEESSPNPIDEKSPETSRGASIIEEFLHENDCDLDATFLSKASLLRIHDAEKLQTIAYELISPPPDFIV